MDNMDMINSHRSNIWKHMGDMDWFQKGGAI